MTAQVDFGRERKALTSAYQAIGADCAGWGAIHDGFEERERNS